eukprot:TRINITY_DN45_c1_g1_i1.p1 TRINITY_DN45_c1_g1~~TRINITY_DN45_c1_g1_i1.p1  ORF type:complete len:2492 (+),score=644.75 TRINITY_DN45_c1_g1_i1:92-7567(+)
MGRAAQVARQVRYLWRVHRLGGGHFMRWVIFEILVPAAVLCTFAGFVELQRQELRSDNEMIPLYDGWPDVGTANSSGGAAVPPFVFGDDMRTGTTLWLAKRGAVGDTTFRRFVQHLRDTLQLPAHRVTEWHAVGGKSGGDRVADLLANPVGLRHWNGWRDWQSVVNGGYGAVIVDSCTPGGCNYTLYSQTVPYDRALIDDDTHDEDLRPLHEVRPLRAWQVSWSALIFFHQKQVAVQLAVQRSIVWALTNSTPPELDLRFTRYNPNTGPMDREDVIKSAVTAWYVVSSFGFFTSLAFAAMFAQMVVTLVQNRTAGVESYLRINGMSGNAYYLAFCLSSLTIRLPLVPILSVFISVYLLPDIPFGETFFFILLYMAALVTLAVLTSFLFTNTTLALVGSLSAYAGAAVIGLMTTGCGYTLLAGGTCYQAWVPLALILPVAASVGLSSMANRQLEHYKHGTMHTSPYTAFAVMMMVIDAIIYTILAWYVGNLVLKGRSVFFPFDRNYWRPQEELEPSVARGVEVSEVSNERGIRGVSLTVPKGRTLSLLGHNGAGKTTVLKLMTGQLEPTSGTVRICGLTPVRACKQGLVGYCPQVALLPQHLTCMDLLEIIACFRGVPLREVTAFAERSAADVGLYDARKTVAAKLPIAQLRKLGIAVATMQSPAVIMLDEPTAGLDLYSRRQVWDLLRRHKGTQTCVFTTHLLDEADLLSDRIAMLQRGVIAPGFQGSQAELKDRFQCGYSIDIVKQSSDTPSEPIVAAIRKRIPSNLQGRFTDLVADAQCKQSSGSRELRLPLPRTADGLHQYVDVLRLLQQESEASELQIESFALGMMGLDDVFARLQRASWSSEQDPEKADDIAMTDVEATIPAAGESWAPPKPVCGEREESIPELITQRAEFVNMFKQIWIIAVRRKLPAILHFRNHSFYIFQVMVPIVLVAIACSFGRVSDRPVPGYLQETSIPLEAAAVWGDPKLGNDNNPVPFYVGGGPRQQHTMSMLQRAHAGSTWAFRNMPQGAEFPLIARNGLAAGAADEVHAPCALELVGNSSFNVWFNATSTYIAPVAAATVANAVLSNATGAAASGTLRQFPGDQYWWRNLPAWVAHGTMIGAALLLLTGLFCSMLVAERANGMRHLQKMCGVHDTVFYVGYGVADWAAAFAVELVLLGFMAIWKVWLRDERYLVLAFLCLVYTPVMLACHYAFTHIVPSSSPTLVVVLVTAGHTLLTFTALVTTSTLGDFSSPLRTAWLWIEPTFIVVDALLYFDNFRNYAGRDVVDDITLTPTGAIERSLLILGLQFLIWSAVLVCCESGYKLRNLVHKCFPRPAEYYAREAAAAGVEQMPSVRSETRRVQRETAEGPGDPECLYFKQVRREYRGHIALSGLYLRLQPGDCLGVLSPPGAGKSTALRIAAGLLPPTQGEVLAHGLSNLFPLQLKRLMQLVGYCPQTDPLPPHLTVAQTLRFFAQLKGLPAAHDPASIERLAHAFGITDHMHVLCRNLSGGVRRLVVLAISLFGAPPIILLDEPTTQMDPTARKRTWGLIARLLDSRRDESPPIVVVATHALREADAVCTRIAVLQRGHLAALGTPWELKDYFASGYFLRVSQTDPRKSSDLHSALTSSVPAARLLGRHGKGVQYQLPLAAPLADLVETIERGREQLAVEDFSLSRLSFEQAYLRTAQAHGHLLEDAGRAQGTVPPLRVVILICGSRGDVQPFLALAEGLRDVGHTVRFGTHEYHRKFVTDGGFDFFPIGGDPEKLMQFMVEHPTMITVDIDEIREKRATMAEIYRGCWECCSTWRPDVIVSNPPIQVHTHIAEKLHVPLQIHFTMPWSPTKAYLHPLAVLAALGNEQSYWIVEEMQWMGLSDIINDFRVKLLGLPKMRDGAGVQHKIGTPHIYCVSEALVPKPTDWGDHITITGFWFLDSLAQNYTPPADLAAFLAAGSAPVYIGFGSIVVADPRALEAAVFGALRNLQPEGVRAIVSPGWAKLGRGVEVPDSVFILERCPHDWLFPRCSAVVHHGGAGTTAAGLRAGCPTVVVPFFGDQPFWGQCCFREGVGPEPIPQKHLTAQKLTEALRVALSPETRAAAKELGDRIDSEAGVRNGVAAFHKYLPVDASCGWEVDCWENQRWFLGIGWSATLTRGDPSAFSDESGYLTRDRDGFPCPDGWHWEREWEVDTTHALCDADGFVYSTGFRSGPWKQNPGPTDGARRRRWVRRRTRGAAVGSTSALQQELDQLRTENERLRREVASQAERISRLLSGVASPAVRSLDGGSMAGREATFQGRDPTFPFSTGREASYPIPGREATFQGRDATFPFSAGREASFPVPVREASWPMPAVPEMLSPASATGSMQRGATASSLLPASYVNSPPLQAHQQPEWSPGPGATHLHRAVDGGCVHVARILVEHCGADIQAMDAEGHTPLGLAKAHSVYSHPEHPLERELEEAVLSRQNTGASLAAAPDPLPARRKLSECPLARPVSAGSAALTGPSAPPAVPLQTAE